jgi:arsenite-transporting ATPase
MRIIIFTGTGGSGISTLSAATAVQLAASGRRTLAFSLYPGLADAFDAALTSVPSEIGENLQAMESRRHRDAPDELRDWIEDLLDWRGMDAILGEDLASLPGLNHVGRLLELEDRIASGDYDAIVLDGAPVAQFLELPPALDAASRWLERIFAPREQTLFEPFLRAFAGDYASTGEEVMDRGRELLERLSALRDLLTDDAVTSVRSVIATAPRAPERLRDAVTALHLFSYSSDAVVLNRLLPKDGLGEFFAGIQSAESEVIDSVNAATQNMPVLRSELRATPPRGLNALRELAAEVYGSAHAPGDVLHRWEPRIVVHDNGQYQIELRLPYAEKADLALEQSDEGVIVHLREHRCVLRVPDEVRGWQAASWTFEAPSLIVTLRP